MSVVWVTRKKAYIGEALAVKPTTGIPAGSTFYEYDTKNNLVFDGTSWEMVTVNWTDALSVGSIAAFHEVAAIAIT